MRIKLSYVFVITHLWFGGIVRADSNPKLAIQFSDAEIPPQVAQKLVSSIAILNTSPSIYDYKTDEGSYEILRSSNRLYLCHIPQKSLYWPNNTLSVPSYNLTYELRNDANFMRRAIDQIFASFSLKECVYVYNFNSGYWTYAFCFGDKIIQYHENLQQFLKTGQHEPEFPDYVYVLGRFKDEDGSKRRSKSRDNEKIMNQSLWKGNNLDVSEFTIIDSDVSPFTSGHLSESRSQRYIQHTLKGGGICDLTNEPRTVDVMYKCDPNDRGMVTIVDIQEVKTCQYQMIVSLPRLCNIPEFRPSDIEDRVTAINCKSIGEQHETSTELDFYQYKEHQDLTYQFPVRKGSKISFADVQLVPLGLGFSIASFKKELDTPSMYLKNRHILIYNGLPENQRDFMRYISLAFEQLLGSKMLAPVFDGEIQRPLQFLDTFILWFEIYDFYGQFLTMVRVERDGSEEKKLLYISLVDPETMLDQDGDLVEVKSMQAPNGAWNYELFARLSDTGTFTETSTVIVIETATAVSEEVAATLELNHDEL